MNRWLDYIQIWYDCSLVIFWDESIKNNGCRSHLKKSDILIVGVIFFSLFLDIDGQSLRLRGPAINWWLFFLNQSDRGRSFSYCNVPVIQLGNAPTAHYC